MHKELRPMRERQSPLWLLTKQPMVNDLVSYLETQRKAIDDAPHRRHVLSFSRQHLRAVRADFADMIRHGEARLHLLCDAQHVQPTRAM